MLKFYVILAALAAGVSFQTKAQKISPMMMKPKTPIICYGKDEDQHHHVSPPQEYLNWKHRTAARTKAADFNVTYIGFEGFPQAKAAFEEAVAIWSTLITSPVTINVTAQWQPLGSNVLGSAIWGSVHANFPGAQKLNTWYPAALAEKIAKQELNEDTPDLFANFNSNNPNWYFGTDGNPQTGQYDLVTVVLHEIGHGLGFVDSYSVSGTQGFVGIQNTEMPIIYDLFLENQAGQNLFLDFDSPSAELLTQLTSDNIFFNSVSATNAKIYAPETFDNGSSISHLDEGQYNGTSNALMTPQIGTMESIHSPGGIVQEVFADIGWVFTYINHTPLRDSENLTDDFKVEVEIESENGPPDIPVLVYNIGAGDVEVPMTQTGPNKFEQFIPNTSNATTYGYYITVHDASDRAFSNPGKIETSAGTEQQYFVFSTGTDTEAPTITHVPKGFILATDAELIIEAEISDNAYIANAKVEYSINDVTQTPVDMVAVVPEELYSAAIDLGAGLADGDVIKYRIVATDNASVPNVTSNPASGFYEVNVVALAATQDSYSNDFNIASSDFFGDGFSITTPSGFSDGAIHSVHPYEKGEGQPDDERNYTYQLRVPIRVASENATVKFEEIVLVEPGENGAAFGSDEFFDFVVVEGSKDGGVNWTVFEAGYDSRADGSWLTRYNSSMDSENPPNSMAIGDPAIFKTRVIDMLSSGEFNPGDEIVIRFRLFSDQLVVGWGWAVDNLRIQIDEDPPVILNDHVDYVFESDEILPIRTNATDPSGLSELKIEYKVNDGTLSLFEFPVTPNTESYTLNLELDGLTVGDLIQYRIVATDNLGNSGVFPSNDGFILVPVIEFEDPVSQYFNDFNSATADFVGNFFSIEQPAGFSNGAIHSVHPYRTGFGLTLTSNLAFTLKKPIIVNEENPFIRFDEVAIVEGHTGGVSFGSPSFKDYVTVEGSKDGGSTWLPLLDGYDAVSLSVWLSTFNNNGSGSTAMFKQRGVSFLSNGNFDPGDEVVIRFRLFTDAGVSGWGWTLDNLHIQDEVTGLETNSILENVMVYPNPVLSDKVFVQINTRGTGMINLNILNSQGAVLQNESLQANGSVITHEVMINNLSSGIYLIKVSGGDKVVTKKILVNR